MRQDPEIIRSLVRRHRLNRSGYFEFATATTQPPFVVEPGIDVIGWYRHGPNDGSDGFGLTDMGIYVFAGDSQSTFVPYDVMVACRVEPESKQSAAGLQITSRNGSEHFVPARGEYSSPSEFIAADRKFKDAFALLSVVRALMPRGSRSSG